MQKTEPSINKRLYKKFLESTGLQKDQMVFPIFVQEKEEQEPELHCMPGTTKVSMRKLTDHIQSIVDVGLSSIIIFGIPKERDKIGSAAANKNGIVQKVLRKIKREFGDALNTITDVCLCQYNISGHCGLVADHAVNGSDAVDNDGTLSLLADTALSHAEAGADVVAPSAMMDGQVTTIRNSLNENGFRRIKILSYSAKHCSSLYTPFRSAAYSKNIHDYNKIDKSSYQVSYTNRTEILREIEADIAEGADMVMIKPAMAYLDLVYMIKEKLGFPTAVQNVSGEYAMIKAAALHGWINEEEWKVNSIASIKRSGADKIISYFARDIARYLTD
ncbi:MAG TPA: porphobilinogen synthase [Nitrososphaeraceae archaeon]|nr:porphobilinogen synthase [Nitrososphaeraceae archaeon]